jgi:hypothetical protein
MRNFIFILYLTDVVTEIKRIYRLICNYRVTQGGFYYRLQNLLYIL